MLKQPIVLAKLSRPNVSHVTSRTRLFTLLDEQRRYPVVWVTGPPGAGKTTFIATYLDTRNVAGIWYQVDRGDADPATFFYYLGQAAGTRSQRKSKPLPLLTQEYLPDLPGFTRRFFRELYSRLPSSAMLVLDNYQEVPAESIFHDVIRQALSEIREGVTVVVISRNGPPPQCADLLANSIIARISWDELRFTLAETTDLANASLKQGVDEETLQWLHAQSNGWGAGLTLLLEHFKRTGAVNHLIQSETMDTIFDYFGGQIFDRTSSDTRDFFLRTAFLPRITVKMAEEISGNADAGKVLEQLYRRHLFTDRRAAEELSYEYHALFRKFLLFRARQSLSVDEYARLSGNAAALLEANGEIDDALPLYQELLDWTAATRLILTHAANLSARGRQQTLRSWIGALPAKTMAEQPWLLYWLGTCDLAVNPAKAREVMERAFVHMRSGEDVLGQLTAASSIVETYLVESANVTGLDKWISALEQMLTRKMDFPSEEVELRALCGMIMAALYRQPQHHLLSACIERAMDLVDHGLEINQTVTAGTCLLAYFTLGFDFEKAARVIARIQPLLDQPALAPIRHISWLVRYARHCAFSADFDNATKNLQKALTITRQEGLYYFESMVHTLHLFTSLSFKDSAVAESLLAKLEPTINPARCIDVAMYHGGKAWVALQRGDLAEALRQAHESLDVANEAGAAFMQAAAYLLLAEIHCEQGHVSIVRRCLQRAGPGLPRSAVRYFKYRSHLIEAYLALKEGDSEAAHEQLQLAMTLAKHQEYMNILWQPKNMARLYAFALERGIEVDYVRRLIKKLGCKPTSPDIESWPWPIKIYTLGRFAMLRDERPLVFTGKSQKKPVDLLKALIAFGGRGVDVHVLVGALWPDPDVDGKNLLDNTLHRLRKLLSCDEVITVQEGRLTLNPQIAWVDVWTFERLTGHVQESRRDTDATKCFEDGGQRAFRLYQGHFLARETEQPWTAPLRERLRSKFIRTITALGQHREDKRQWNDAIELYQRGIEMDPLAEELYRRLMSCHVQCGNHAEALSVYRRCRDMLSIVLNVTPSSETEALHQQVRRSLA